MPKFKYLEIIAAFFIVGMSFGFAFESQTPKRLSHSKCPLSYDSTTKPQREFSFTRPGFHRRAASISPSEVKDSAEVKAVDQNNKTVDTELPSCDSKVKLCELSPSPMNFEDKSNSSLRKGLRNFEARAECKSTQLTAIDKFSSGTALLNTSSSLAAELSYHLKVSKTWTPYVFYKQESSVFFAPSPGLLKNTSITLQTMGAGLKMTPFEKLDLGVQVATGQHPYLLALSRSFNTLDIQAAPNLTGHVGWRIFSEDPFTVRVSTEISNDFSATAGNYQIQNNFGIRNDVTIRDEFVPGIWTELTVFAKFTNEDTSLVTQRQSDIGIGLALSFLLDPPKK